MATPAMRGENPFKNPESLKRVLNIGVISSLLAIIIYVSGIHMPSPVSIAARHLSNLAAPLSMMVIGQSMIHLKPKDMFGDIRLLVFSLIKLIAIPIIGMFVLRLFIQDQMILNVCYIMLTISLWMNLPSLKASAIHTPLHMQLARKLSHLESIYMA